MNNTHPIPPTKLIILIVFELILHLSISTRVLPIFTDSTRIPFSKITNLSSTFDLWSLFGRREFSGFRYRQEWERFYLLFAVMHKPCTSFFLIICRKKTREPVSTLPHSVCAVINIIVPLAAAACATLFLIVRLISHTLRSRKYSY